MNAKPLKATLLVAASLACLLVWESASASSQADAPAGTKQRQQPEPPTESRRTAPDVSAAVPLADLAGAQAETLAPTLRNPVGGDAAAIQRGEALYRTMNCASCHGYNGKGGMGPDLTDQFWLYGGTPVMIFKSIHEGRPQGMPAWKNMLPANSIWDITAYIQSYGGAFAADEHQAAMNGDVQTGATRPAEKGASPNTRGRR